MRKEILYASAVSLILITVLIFSSYKRDEIGDVMKIDICENINSGKMKIICYSMFLKDYTYCNLAGDFSTYCYDSTFPLIELNETFCRSFTNNYAKLSCFTNLAIKSRNAEACELIGEPAVVDVCYTNLFDYVELFAESGICEKLSLIHI